MTTTNTTEQPESQSSGKADCSSANEFDLGLKYRWGFDVFRTASQVGIGFALSFRSRYLIGLWVGPWYLTYGQQIVWEDWALTTSTTGQRQ